jgi:modification methylase
MPKLPLRQIIHGDALTILPEIPQHSVDLVFADPPYNLQLQGDLWRPNLTQVDAVTDEWDKFETLEAYDTFTRNWLTAVRRVMKPDATIWVSGTYHNIFRVGAIMQDLGFWILNTITWHKINAMPNFRGKRLKNDIEFVIWAKYDDRSAYTFNHHTMKQFNDGKQLGSVWSIPACGGKERLRGPDGKKLHSTQKPEKLLQRILLASSRAGAVVLDPFSGTGTTAAVAKMLRRKWIGIERDPVYVKASRGRLRKVEPLAKDHPLLQRDVQDRQDRVPFKRLIAKGLIRVGDALYLDSPEVTAHVLANGLIATNDLTGSIHKIGCILKDIPSCNGWMHWYFIDEQGNRQQLDVLRQRLRTDDKG